MSKCYYCKHYCTIDKRPYCKMLDRNSAYLIVLGGDRKNNCPYYEK